MTDIKRFADFPEHHALWESAEQLDIVKALLLARDAGLSRIAQWCQVSVKVIVIFARLFGTCSSAWMTCHSWQHCCNGIRGQAETKHVIVTPATC